MHLYLMQKTKPLKSVEQVQNGEQIQVRVADGVIRAEVFERQAF